MKKICFKSIYLCVVAALLCLSGCSGADSDKSEIKQDDYIKVERAEVPTALSLISEEKVSEILGVEVKATEEEQNTKNKRFLSAYSYANTDESRPEFMLIVQSRFDNKSSIEALEQLVEQFRSFSSSKSSFEYEAVADLGDGAVYIPELKHLIIVDKKYNYTLTLYSRSTEKKKEKLIALAKIALG